MEAELSAFLDGELPSARQAVVARHLQGCGECAAVLDGLGLVKAMVSELPRPEARRSFTLGQEYVMARPALTPRRSPWAFAPALTLTLFLALIAVDLAGNEATDGSTAGLSVAQEAPKSMPESAGRAADQAPPAGAGGATQSLGPGSAPAATPAGGLQPFSAPVPADTSRQAPAPQADDASSTGETQPSAAEPDMETSSRTDWLSLLQLAAFAAFVISLVAVLAPRMHSKRGGSS
jgi:anti-sigma factor RsiW